MRRFELPPTYRALKREFRPAPRSRLVDIANHNTQARNRDRLGDPGFHQAATDDGELLDAGCTPSDWLRLLMH